MRCHGSKEINFFGVPRKFKCFRGGYARVTSLETLVLKENVTIQLLVDGILKKLLRDYSMKLMHHEPDANAYFIDILIETKNK